MEKGDFLGDGGDPVAARPPPPRVVGDWTGRLVKLPLLLLFMGNTMCAGTIVGEEGRDVGDRVRMVANDVGVVGAVVAVVVVVDGEILLL